MSDTVRKGLLEGGATSKYLLYSIGEIALVVIGILIALQINNWNEWRKDRITELEVLDELKVNLELNVQKLQSQIIRKRRHQISSQVILKAIESNQTYNDSLEAHFGWGLTFENTGPMSRAGYEAFKNIGVDIITNKPLKNEIIYLFEDEYLISQTRMKSMAELRVELVKLRQQHLLRKSGFNFAPFNYDKLIKDKHFYSWVMTILNSRVWVTTAMEDSLEETLRVLQLIKDELREE